ncbi:hypothetical protein STEG23_008214 [Scotinomys teguina]
MFSTKVSQIPEAKETVIQSQWTQHRGMAYVIQMPQVIHVRKVFFQTECESNTTKQVSASCSLGRKEQASQRYQLNIYHQINPKSTRAP